MLTILKRLFGLFSHYGYNSKVLDAVRKVSKWDTSNVTNIHGVFSGYGYESTVLDFTLDLSNWNVKSVLCDEESDYIEIFLWTAENASNWSVTIPAKTGEKDNTETQWFVGDGTNYIELAVGRSFTVAQ